MYFITLTKYMIENIISMHIYIIYKLTHKIVQIIIKYDTGFSFPIVSIYFCLDHIPLNLSFVI